MKSIETELKSLSGPGAEDLNEKLDRLDQRASRLSLPVAFSLYTLRSNVALIRDRLKANSDIKPH